MPAANSVVSGRLHDLLPDLLNALSERFECVECELEKSPDLSAAPFRLPAGRVGSQLCVISKAECAEVGAAISTHLAGGRSLGTIQGRHILTTDDSAALGLRLRLKNAAATAIDRSLWRPAARDCVRRLRATGEVPAEFLCLEVANGAKAEISLLADEAPALSTATVNVLDVWIFPATKVVGTRPVENGTPDTPKPKKRIRRVVKSTNPDGTPKKTLVSTKTIVENGGLKKIKKTIVDKSSPKENSPDVVQEVVEDPANVSFLIRMGQPANGVDPPPASNGIAHSNVPDGKAEENGKMFQPNGRTEIRPRAPDLPIVNQTRPSPPPPPAPASSLPVSANRPKIAASQQPLEVTNSSTIVESTIKSTSPSSNSTTQSPASTESAAASTSSGSSDSSTESTASAPAASTTQTPSNVPNILPLAKEESEQPNGSLPSSILASVPPESASPSTTPIVLNEKPEVEAEIPKKPEEKPRVNQVPHENGVVEKKEMIWIDEKPSEKTPVLPAVPLDISALCNRNEITPSPLFSERVLSPLTANGRRLSPLDSDLSLFDDLSTASTLTTASQRRGTSERRRSTMSPIVEGVASTTVRGMGEVPVIALQLVLSTFSFEELARLRRVHPHWDEICGQLLNSGYYDLIHRADVLLTDCQRRANAESKLQRPLQVLTNLQVHVLNPVDMLRAAMDEGVLCFPYGELLDKVGALLDRVESVMSMSEEDGDGVVLNVDRLIKLARSAQLHYRRFVEPEVEKRMTEVYKLSAQQRLQRLDSFLVESTVTKLEKVAGQNKDELKWDIDQLKSQNSQLKKDNRELKQLCARLESRIEMIERKFKTMARLLQ